MAEPFAGATPRRIRPMTWVGLGLSLMSALLLILAISCGRDAQDTPMTQGKTTADFPEVADDLFHGMDGGVVLTTDEIKGRNTWMIWTADNDEFWDQMASYAYGTTDLLKMLDTRRHDSRFAQMGVISDPNCAPATHPDPYGLWLDTPVKPEPASVKRDVYGLPSGVLGLRLFPNPAFKGEAAAKWMAQVKRDGVGYARSYYDDPNYYNDPKLVRPYRVGMACSFCHVAPNPLHPPVNPERPEMADLSAYIGNQYLRVSQVFGNGLKESNFVYQLIDHIARGALDTSFFATDNLNNPSNMNAVFSVADRLAVAEEENLGQATLAYPGTRSHMAVPHVLKDGGDSIGMLGALNRVFVNIGMFHNEWLRDHNVMVGGVPQHPFEIAKAQKNSVCWMATQERMGHLASYFIKAAVPLHLEDAPGGRAFLTRDPQVLERGKVVFAENCAGCHSSKRPPAGLDGRSPEGKAWYRRSVLAADFRDHNFLSNDQRISVAVVGTNAARALATNATRGHVWDNFSSETYKHLPSVGTIDYYDPFDGQTRKFAAPAGGPGYYRVPSLISVWSSAPFFHNNKLGTFVGDPSVAGRMQAYEDAMNKLLWPERRLGIESIMRTSTESWLEIPAPYLPSALRGLADNGFLKIGPIPKGTPINLLANANLELTADPIKAARLVKVALKVKTDLLGIRLRHLDADQSREVLKNLIPDLMSISKCPDFVEDRGHLFGTKLPDADKHALIEFVKTL